MIIQLLRLFGLRLNVKFPLQVKNMQEFVDDVNKLHNGTVQVGDSITFQTKAGDIIRIDFIKNY